MPLWGLLVRWGFFQGLRAKRSTPGFHILPPSGSARFISRKRAAFAARSGFYMRPTVFFARADGIHLRLLYSLRLGRQSVLDRHFRKPFVPDKRGRPGIRPAANAH